MLTFLSGLTCTEENFMVKSGAQRVAAELGLMLVSPDTSPRGESVPDDPDGDYDFGLAAGFYLNATEEPVVQALPDVRLHHARNCSALVFDNFPGDPERHGLTGHSMGGHGALTIGLRNPQMFRSLSAFAPICTTLAQPVGPEGAGLLPWQRSSTWQRLRCLRGCADARARWRPMIASSSTRARMTRSSRSNSSRSCSRRPARKVACRSTFVSTTGYDHGYYFISTFIEEHLRFHAERLGA